MMPGEIAPFRMKAKTKPGQCAAMRCKEPAGDGGLCSRHASLSIGSPPPAGVAIVPAKASKSAALARVTPTAVRTEIEPTRANLTQALEIASQLPLDCQERLDGMGQIRAFAVSARDWIDEHRKRLKAPSLAEGREIDDACRPSLDLARAVIECVDTRLKAFRSEQRDAQDAATVAAGQGARDEATLVAVRGGELELPEQVTTRQVLCVRLVNAAGQPCERVSESAVAKEFCQLDESLALDYARHRGYDKCQVPGLQFYFEEQIVKARGAM